MKLPTPDDPADSPVWDNYVVAQAVHASLTLIPPRALAFGVKVDRSRVRLVFQLTEITDQDRRDMNEIWRNFESLVGDEIDATVDCEVRRERVVSPYDGVRWVFLSRVADEYD